MDGNGVERNAPQLHWFQAPEDQYVEQEKSLQKCKIATFQCLRLHLAGDELGQERCRAPTISPTFASMPCVHPPAKQLFLLQQWPNPNTVGGKKGPEWWIQFEYNLEDELSQNQVGVLSFNYKVGENLNNQMMALSLTDCLRTLFQ